MTQNRDVTFVSEPELRKSVAALFGTVRQRIASWLPDAEILHVGSTAIRGSLTKGDLDVQVRVSASDYPAAQQALAARYAVNDGGFCSADATSFEDYGAQPPHGAHLTVIDGSRDIQWRFRDALNGSDRLRREYDELKRSFEGKSMEAYRDAKYYFVLRVQRTTVYRRSDEPAPARRNAAS